MALTVLICTVIVLAIVIPVNILIAVFGARYISRMYQEQFEGLTVILREGLADRDAKFQKLKASLAVSVIRDADLFDTALDDYTDLTAEEIDNEREEDNEEGDQ